MAAFLTMGAAFPGMAQSSTNEGPEYMPVLPQVLDRALQVDPQKGYLVTEVKPDVFVITDGIYQSTFFVTEEGVILVDAPPTFASHIQHAVGEVTEQPIRMIIYSHSHLDHIAGTALLAEAIPGLEIVAEQGVTDYLREKSDTRRPQPTTSFVRARTIKLGSTTLELVKASWHSDEGDVLVYAAEKRLLIAIDTIAAGYVPFMDLDLSSNAHEYMKVFDQLLGYDFDILVPGHLTSLATREDVVESRDYTFDVYRTVKRIHDSTDQMQVMSAAAEKYSWSNKYAIFRTLLDGVIDQCDREIQERWKSKLAGVDVWGSSHCRAMLIYARWDD